MFGQQGKLLIEHFRAQTTRTKTPVLTISFRVPIIRVSPYLLPHILAKSWPMKMTKRSLAPHISGTRDMPRCGALSLLQKTPHYRGGQINCCYVKSSQVNSLPKAKSQAKDKRANYRQKYATLRCKVCVAPPGFEIRRRVSRVAFRVFPAGRAGDTRTAIKLLSRISVGGISVVSVVVCLCSGRWLVGPFRTSNKLFYLTRPQLALLKSLPCSDR